MRSPAIQVIGICLGGAIGVMGSVLSAAAQRGSAVVYAANHDYVELGVNTESLAPGTYLGRVKFALNLRALDGRTVTEQFEFTDATLPTIERGRSLKRYFRSTNAPLASVAEGKVTWVTYVNGGKGDQHSPAPSPGGGGLAGPFPGTSVGAPPPESGTTTGIQAGHPWKPTPAADSPGSRSVTPDAAVEFNGQLYLFSIGSEDHRHYFNTLNGARWSGWKEVPGGGTATLSDAAAVYNGRLYLFGIGIGDHQHYVNTFDGSAWSGWSALPGGGTTLHSDAAVSFGGRLFLFAVGGNDHQHYVNTFDGSRWAGWQLVPAATPGPKGAVLLNR